MQQLWDQILHLLSLMVSPDWGGLVALIPIGLAAIVVLYMGWLVLKLATAGPTRTGRRRLAPQPPPGTHLPGGSASPLLISVGAAILLLGIVLRGPILALGAVALVLAVLNWGREAMRDFEHVAGAEGHGEGSLALAPALPPGVHLPGPSFRPVLLSISAGVLLFGLVLGVAVLAAGALMLLVTLVGWLRDARAEYSAVEAAEHAGHLAQSGPGVPTGTLTLFGVVLVAAIVIQGGLIPIGGAPASNAGGGAPASSPPAGAAGGSNGSPAPSAAGGSGSPGSSAGQGASLKITAHNIAFDVQSLTAPANTPFTIAFTNDDQGVPHNVAIHKDSPTGTEVWKGDIVTGPVAVTYNVPALPPGTYGFACSVHPNMTGTLTVR